MLTKKILLACSPASETYGAVDGTRVPRDMTLAEPLVSLAVDFAAWELDGVESGALGARPACSVLGVPADVA